MPSVPAHMPAPSAMQVRWRRTEHVYLSKHLMYVVRDRCCGLPNRVLRIPPTNFDKTLPRLGDCFFPPFPCSSYPGIYIQMDGRVAEYPSSLHAARDGCASFSNSLLLDQSSADMLRVYSKATRTTTSSSRSASSSRRYAVSFKQHTTQSGEDG